MTFFDPELLDPKVHCFARCHWCKHLVPISSDAAGDLQLDERECPNCKAQLSETKIISSFAFQLMLTASIASANKITGLNLIVIPMLIANLLLAYMEFSLWLRTLYLILYHFPIVIILEWFRRYWCYFQFNDEEYITAVKEMRNSLILWSAALAVVWISICGSP